MAFLWITRRHSEQVKTFAYFCGMILTDTHTHLYLEQFEFDRDEMVRRALDASVKYMLLPNIDSESLPGLLSLCSRYPDNIFPMIGLHPTDVKADWQDELTRIMAHLQSYRFYAIGETGIDLYWDKTFLTEQKLALQFQIDLALEHQLPIVLHVRDSFDEIFEVLEQNADQRPGGVFHCFTGTAEQAKRAIDLGFMLGIGGVLTYKNAGLDNVLSDIDLEHLILETDSPFLTPNPFRGKRNESSYLRFVAVRLAEIKGISVEEVAKVTTQNAVRLFRFPFI